jgi:nicotinamide-nucleotide amidase
MKAEILSIGTELLIGDVIDTNSNYMASCLPALGVQLMWVSQVGDNLDMLKEALVTGLARSDIIFTTGGLGPTKDDITREAIANTLGEEMVIQEAAVVQLQDYFEARGLKMPSHNLKQASLIPSASAIPNRHGTAPGWWVERDGNTIVAMPGPPNEMQAMWQEDIVPRLKQIAKDSVIITRTIKTTGLAEAAVDEAVSQWLGGDNPYVGIYSKSDGIHLTIIARANNEEASRTLIRPVEEELVRIMEPYVWGFDNETPEQVAGGLLIASGLTLATMESCTGGLLASVITDVPGSSVYFKGGQVTYSNNAKVAAGVPADLIQNHGAVSEQVAVAMAVAARGNFAADIGIGITGVAGPRELEQKPVGLLHIALSSDEVVRQFTMRFPQRRERIKRRGVAIALIELSRMIKEASV